jgi:hypothetical protein
MACPALVLMDCTPTIGDATEPLARRLREPEIVMVRIRATRPQRSRAGSCRQFWDRTSLTGFDPDAILTGRSSFKLIPYDRNREK